MQIAAPAAVDPATVLDRVQARRLDRCEQFAIVAAREAWADAGSPDVDPDRLGVVVSSGIGGVASTLTAYDTLQRQGLAAAVPVHRADAHAERLGGLDRDRAGTRAPGCTPRSARARPAPRPSATRIDMIRSGRADVVLAGGTEAAIMPLNIAAFAAMRALSTRNDEPERASRPFDKGRDGFLLGEGAGMVVLESAEHAARRGATVHRHRGRGRVLLGRPPHRPARSGRHRDRPGPSSRRWPTPASRAEQIVHVNAHATSTPAGDVVEGQAIARALGAAAAGVVVSATKSMTGHLLGGAGAVESVATILALRDHVAPPTINLDDPDDEAGIDIATEPREAGAARQRPDGRAEQLVRLRRGQRRARLHRRLNASSRCPASSSPPYRRLRLPPGGSP